jgi:hypothetical protein
VSLSELTKELFAQPWTVLFDEPSMPGNGSIEMLERRSEIVLEHLHVVPHRDQGLKEIRMPELGVRKCGLVGRCR